jgi:hypothetical protein
MLSKTLQGRHFYEWKIENENIFAPKSNMSKIKLYVNTNLSVIKSRN